MAAFGFLSVGDPATAAEFAATGSDASSSSPDVASAPPGGKPSAPSAAAGLATTAVTGAVAIGAPAVPQAPPLDVVEGVIERGASLAGSLGARGVPSRMVYEINEAMEPHFDFRKARPGHRYRLVRDVDGRLVSFVYRTSPDGAFFLEHDGAQYRVQQHEAELIPRPTMIAGLVSTTLYGAVTALGERGQLARDFADVFAWDIDFQRSVRPGDAFQIVYERLHRVGADGTEIYVRPGRILGARYDGAEGRHTAIYFEPQEGRGGYYRPDGSSVEGEFLMAPLRSARITSKYTHARLHPILKVTRPHQGIDYAAPTGAPVWAVAGGEVVYRARAGGFGNLVKVRHKNGYVSYYAHLSRYASGLRVGQRVEQKQVIGYVGQTGLATGPHVCFRVQKDGQYVNPAQLRTGTRASVPEDQKHMFDVVRDLLLAQLDGRRILAGGPIPTPTTN